MIRKYIMSVTTNCILSSLKDHNTKIKLPHRELVYLGRNEFTMLLDPTLSRKQVAATANYDKNEIEIETLGTNTSGCNGYALRKLGKYKLKHGDRLELILGSHIFLVAFEPEPYCEAEDEPATKKPKQNFSVFNSTGESSKVSVSVNDTSYWDSIDNGDLLIYTSAGAKSQTKVAAFDLDGTIIRTKSGARFPKDYNDWVFNFPDVPKHLCNLYNDDYKIVVFTNQARIKHDAASVKGMKQKIEDITSRMKVPMQVFIATCKNVYRKPAPGMWLTFCNERNDRLDIDALNSFYVGDAAGREKNWAPKKSKDHSVSDRLFAINLDLRFFTPEEYFLKAKHVAFKMPLFDPRSILQGTNPLPQVGVVKEVIIMVGSPASGKSFFCREHLINNGYTYASRDKLGSWQSCVKAVEKSLLNNQSVVVDNTNGDKASRRRFIDVAKKLKVQCRCFIMTTSWSHCKHNNRFRELTDKTHVPVADVILNSYKKKFEEPMVDEGFEEICKIDFIPKFDNEENEKLYKMFLLES